VELATLTLQCLSFDAYLDYLKRALPGSQEQCRGMGAVLRRGAGAPPWSTRLASNYTTAKVKSTLQGGRELAECNSCVAEDDY